jgi:pre-mRNA-splicing factor ISY1
MARSQEKAMSMLNRWVDQKRAAESGRLESTRPSRFASECQSIKECEMVRSQLIRQITGLFSQIQNAATGEQKVRELNDELNRLQRVRGSWEMQLRKLGGVDYSITKSHHVDFDGVEVPGQGGYKYYGAAKELPGVRELLEDNTVTGTRRHKGSLMQHIHPSYYGWRDEENSEILETESVITQGCQDQRNAECRSRRCGALLAELRTSGASDATLEVLETQLKADINMNEFDRAVLDMRRQLVLEKYIKDMPSSGPGS